VPPPWPHERGPLPTRIDELRDGDPYELSDGRLIYCPPATQRLGEMRTIAALVLGTDPAVQSMGINVGHALSEHTLRAPDLSVGDMSECESGWAAKAPALGVEYASEGEDEADLQLKIKQLLAGGSRFVWVVRLVGPRRVEVYEPGRAVQTKRSGERLEAPGIVKNAPLVESLYDDDEACKQALQNLLERKGYAGLDAVLAEGRAKALRGGEAEGKAEGLRAAVLDVCEVFGIEPSPAQRTALEAMGVGELETLRTALKKTKRWPG
jgi:Putative restriction endonuclease